ncbi:MAG: beta-lactamase [Firmicutes bacterium]|nr:beta-lactamase [Bacillota bacterium]
MNESIKIHVLECGKVQVDKALPFHENNLNPIAYTGRFRSIYPSGFYVSNRTSKGLVLIDTGWHTDVRVDQIRQLGRFHYMINKAILPEGQAIKAHIIEL